MEEKEKFEELTKSLKSYIQTNIELIKLEASDRTSIIGSSFISIILISFTVILFLLFISIGLGFYLSNCFNDSYTGFILIAFFYLIMSLLLILFRKKLIENPMRNKIIRIIFKK